MDCFSGKIWHHLPSKEVLGVFQVDPDKGLDTLQVKWRTDEFGPNALTARRGKTKLERFMLQFHQPLIYILIVAGIITAALGEGVDSAVIFGVVLVNAIVGYIQEAKAVGALEALAKSMITEAVVIRCGATRRIPAEELVPGDVVVLRSGDKVPADLRLVSVKDLRVDESALTGESVPVGKLTDLLPQDSVLGDRRNMAYASTMVTYGQAAGVVIGTGDCTEIGRISTMVSEADELATPLTRKITKFSHILLWAILALAAVTFAAGVLRGEKAADMFMAAVALAVGAIPEGLPAAVTVILAMGVSRMAARGAIIRKLPAVETLGGASVICSDKTGTLTQNAMTVTRLWVDGSLYEVTGSGYHAEGDFLLDGKAIDFTEHPAARAALWVGALNNDAVMERLDSSNGSTDFRIIGDPTEGAILVAAAKAGAFPEDLNRAYPRLHEIPFDSERKRMVTIHQIHQPRSEDLSPFASHADCRQYIVQVKGAPDIVLDLCSHFQSAASQPAPLTETARRQILEANDAMTRDALRVLGVAYRIVSALPEEITAPALEKELVFAGLIGMIDPAREEVRPALQKASRAGVRTIMITGDYPNTARAIAESIGLLRPGRQVLTGSQVSEMDDAALQREVRRTDVFARVSPEHKMRIVDALKANGEVVAMTGDGVNDAPAIKRADIGVSMGITGTDVAKETADMVLTDDNYASIVSAVEQGRIIYSNIRKFVYYLVSCNLAEIFIIFIPTVFGRFLFPGVERVLTPLTPIQLLWLNLITDGAPALALGTEKGDPDIMQQPPRPPKEPIINSFMRTGVLIQTAAITAVTLIAFGLGLKYHAAAAGTMAFLTLSLSELLRAFTARSERYPLLKIGIFGNKWMNLAVLFSLALLLMVVYVPFLNPVFHTVPLGWDEWVFVLPLLIVPSLAAEAGKFFITYRARRVGD